MTLTFGRIYRSSCGPHVLCFGRSTWASGPPAHYIAADSLSEAMAAWVVQQVFSIRAGPYRESRDNLSNTARHIRIMYVRRVGSAFTLVLPGVLRLIAISYLVGA